MIDKYVCRHCGEAIEINFDIVNTDRKCKSCGRPITLKNDDGTLFGRLLQNLEETKRSFEALVQKYLSDGNSDKIHTAVMGYERYIKKEGYDKDHNMPDFKNMWRDFIINTAGAARQRNDSDLKNFLKRHAVDLDKAIASDGKTEKINLFFSMLIAYPDLAGINDWNDLVENTDGDKESFKLLCEPLINYIVKNNDRAFAMEIFNKIKSKGKLWRTQGLMYIRELFSNEEAANKVFAPDKFDRETRRFAEEVHGYCKEIKGFTQWPVWKNYEKKLESIRLANAKRLVAVMISAVVLIAVTALAGFITLNSADKSTIEFKVDKIIEITYGDGIYMGDYTVTYNKISGEKVTRGLTLKNLEGFDPETVGKKQTAYFKFKGKTEAVTIIVNPLGLDAPVLVRTGNYVTWDAVEGAESYSVYLNSEAVLTVRSEPFSYDLTSYEGSGEMSVTVRANSSSDKYLDSPVSGAVSTFKLAPPSNIMYSDGKLTWNAVEGAAVYELNVNGTVYTAYYPECDVSFLKGNNDITVTARSSVSTHISGTSHESIYHFRLDAITSMLYADGVITWQADEYADTFAIYVDGKYWRDLSRNRLLLQADGFISEFGETEHTIGIVCKSTASGTEASEMRTYTVILGSSVSMSGETLRFPDIGTGASYFVNLNGTEYTIGEPYIVFSEYKWQTGENTLSLTAKLGDTEYIFGTVKLTKLAAPAVSLTPMGWSVSGGSGCLYSVNGGAWENTLPPVASLAAGDYTVRAKRVPSSESSFEIPSDVAEIKINKAPVPVITVSDGELIGQFDSGKYYVKLYYAPKGTQTWTEISSLDGIHIAGTYDIKASLSARQEAFVGYTGFVASEYSETVTVVKPSAPDVIYDAEAGLIYSNVAGAKFYYTDENGAEHEIQGGRVSNMPGGVFRVYARLDAAGANTLDSENTPEAGRVSVFNMDITLSMNKVSGSNSQCYVIFGGCSDISSISYSYKINYYGADGAAIGGIDKSFTARTVKKGNSADKDKIVDMLNYRLDGSFENGYSFSDVKRIELIVYIDGGDGEPFQRSVAINI